jgi:Kef-type K+ transport system membrane component KefB
VLYEHKGWKDAIDVTLGEANLPDKTVEKLKRALLSESFPKYFNLARSVLLFSSLGVVLLLFMVGLECSLEEMKEVGGSATVVALLGVIIPFILGYATTLLILPMGIDSNVPIFIGATLCATSIGITARVFKDMNRLGMVEAKIVMSAAVLDDIFALIILAIVTGIVTSGSIEVSTIVMIFLKASIFLSTVLFVGTKFLKQQIAFFAKLDQSHVRLIFPFSLLMILSWLADAIGLATIIGAFAAGLIIKEEYFTRHHGEHSVESIIAPIASWRALCGIYYRPHRRDFCSCVFRAHGLTGRCKRLCKYGSTC